MNDVGFTVDDGLTVYTDGVYITDKGLTIQVDGMILTGGLSVHNLGTFVTWPGTHTIYLYIDTYIHTYIYPSVYGK